MEIDHTEHLLLLGKIAVNGQSLELIAGIVLGQTLGVKQHVAGVIAGHMQISGVLNVIDALTTDVAVKSWVKLARKASEARNKMIHGAWAFDESLEAEGGVHIQRGRFRDGGDRVAELTEAVNLLYEVITTAPGQKTWLPAGVNQFI
ncbi:hypothetical protein [Agreia sp. COWG]|uniref:hypothetical protein n=1 Tax=Agreia sp. COWG TaxID=2773266 RepID=UPI001927BC6A|nr:hypothetical protein [Agreia sp. COWG]